MRNIKKILHRPTIQKLHDCIVSQKEEDIMKNLIALSLVGVLALTPLTAFADESSLEERIAALEERVSILEAQLNATPEGAPTVHKQVETGMVEAGCSLTFKRFELSKDYSGKDIVILYFDFFNDSGSTKSADHAFEVKVFQNDREQPESFSFDSDAGTERYTEFRSGADPVEVAYASTIQDMSDIIVNISNPFISGGDNFVEFSLSLGD